MKRSQPQDAGALAELSRRLRQARATKPSGDAPAAVKGPTKKASSVSSLPPILASADAAAILQCCGQKIDQAVAGLDCATGWADSVWEACVCADHAVRLQNGPEQLAGALQELWDLVLELECADNAILAKSRVLMGLHGLRAAITAAQEQTPGEAAKASEEAPGPDGVDFEAWFAAEARAAYRPHLAILAEGIDGRVQGNTNRAAVLAGSVLDALDGTAALFDPEEREAMMLAQG